MKYLIAILYRYYDDGSTRTIAYGMALMVTVALLTINIGSLLIIIYGEIGFLDMLAKQEENVFLIFFIYLIISSILLRLCYPKKIIISYISDHDVNSQPWLVIFCITLTILLFTIMCASRKIF